MAGGDTVVKGAGGVTMTGEGSKFRASSSVVACSLVWVSLLPLRLYLCLYLCLFLSACASDDSAVSSGVSRDWVSVGDLHGDLKRAKEVLALAGLTDEHGNWNKKKKDPTKGEGATHHTPGHGQVQDKAAAKFALVQTGDLVDRGHDSIRVLEFFDEVREGAALQGDEVVLLLGNHELMNLKEDFRYVSPRELQRLGTRNLKDEAENEGRPVKVNSREARERGLAVWRDLFSRDESVNGTWGKKLVGERRIASIRGTGGCRTLFVHAGVTLAHLTAIAKTMQKNEKGDIDIDIDDISSKKSGDELVALLSDSFFGSPGDSDSDPLSVMLQGTLGPVWYRPYAQAPEGEVCLEVREVLRQVGARHMVVGHTPQKKITTRCDKNELVMIDVAMSRAYGGQIAALECTREAGGGTFTAIYKEQRREVLFKDNNNNDEYADDASGSGEDDLQEREPEPDREL